MLNLGKYINRKKIDRRNTRIIISRTDNIGDVILTLPLAGIIKNAIPGAYIIFLGKTYTKPVIQLSEHIDEFADWDAIKKLDEEKQISEFKKFNADVIIHVFPQHSIARIAKKAGIKKRIGTSGRIYHHWLCNRLVFFTRRRSKLHESQLNIKLLRFLGVNRYFPLHEIPKYYGIIPSADLPEKYRELIDNKRFNLILHPKSKGNAREWPVEYYSQLIDLLPRDKFKIFISGTEEDKKELQTLTSKHPDVIDLIGKLTLEEFIGFIANADGLVACSTGPLHIAAAMGKYAIGIFPPIKPMHPGRWAPIGTNASFLVENKKCSKCRITKDCECIKNIKPETVKNKLMEIFMS